MTPAPRTPAPAETTSPIPVVPQVPLPRAPGRHRSGDGVPRPREATHSGGIPTVRRRRASAPNPSDTPGTAAPATGTGTHRVAGSPATGTGGHPASAMLPHPSAGGAPARHAAGPGRPATRTGEHRTHPAGPGGTPPAPPTATGEHRVAGPGRPTVDGGRRPPGGPPATRTGGHPVHPGAAARPGPAGRTGSHPVTAPAPPPRSAIARTGGPDADGPAPAPAPAPAPTRSGAHPAHTGTRGTHTGAHPTHTGAREAHTRAPAPAYRPLPPLRARTDAPAPARGATGEHPVARTGGHPVTRTGEHPVSRTGSHPVTRTGQHPVTRTGAHPVAGTGEHSVARTTERPATATGAHPAAGALPAVDVPTPAHGLVQVSEAGVVTCGCEPTLTRSLRADGKAAPLTEHREAHGELAPPPRGELTELVAAGLVRGRGGAGFPLAAKLKAATSARTSRRAPEVVVNGAESEPASIKDRTLLTRAPHLVLDGAQLLAAEIGARGVTVWVHDFAAAEAVGHALGERDDPVAVTVVRAPDGYLAGESSAALAHLGGNPARPAFALRPAAELGPYGRAVVVSNAETTAAVAALLAHGLDQHRATGTPDEPGTRLLTVYREPGRPVLVEASTGTTVVDALGAAGARTDVTGVLVGGYFGRWLPPADALGAPLSHAGMAEVGGSLGAGLVLAPAGGSCLLGEVAAVVGYLAGQNAGQCGPCVNGLPALARTLDAVVSGEAGPEEVARVHDLAATIAGRGACKHPDGVTMFAASAVDVLSAEVQAHLTGGCSLPRGGWLPLPSAEPEVRA